MFLLMLHSYPPESHQDQSLFVACMCLPNYHKILDASLVLNEYYAAASACKSISTSSIQWCLPWLIRRKEVGLYADSMGLLYSHRITTYVGLAHDIDMPAIAALDLISAAAHTSVVLISVLPMRINCSIPRYVRSWLQYWWMGCLDASSGSS